MTRKGSAMLGQRQSFSGALGNPPRINWTAKNPRVCTADGCGTILSLYNSSIYCWLHDSSREYAKPGPQFRSTRNQTRPGRTVPRIDS
jgi:hypothetical protein